MIKELKKTITMKKSAFQKLRKKLSGKNFFWP